MAYTKYSLTPANNTAAPPDGAPEGMLPSAVNDTMRDMMAQIRDCGDGVRDGTYTMTTPKITGGTITGVVLTGNTLTNPVITGATLTTSVFNGTVGATTASTGAFTTLSASGVATFSAGTAALPAITTTGDTNTGIFFPAADTIAFSEGGTESMRIDSSGNLLVGTTTTRANAGDVQVSKGISFPATQSAQSNANTLDDYEEGTWTPIDSSGSSLTFTGVSAYYTKIGNMVFATFELVYPASSSSANNVIGGLPFTTATGDAMNAFNVSYTTYTPGLMSPLDANATTFTLYDTTTVAAINNVALLSKLVRGTCIYKVA